MITFQSQRQKDIYVVIYDIIIPVPPETDWVTVDTDGEVAAWVEVKPLLRTYGKSSFFYNPARHSGIQRRILLGQFVRDGGESFEPLIIKA